MHHKIFILSFIAILLIFGSAYFLTSDNSVSYQERRMLMTLEEVKQESMMDRNFAERFEQYALDQIQFRDSFRNLKAAIAFDVLKQKDFHGLYKQDEHWFKKQSPYQMKQVENFKTKMLPILQANQGAQSYLFLIPLKSYYIGDTTDFDKMESELQNLGTIDLSIKDQLDVNSYYIGDPHVKQDTYLLLLDQLVQELRLPIQEVSYEKETYPDFYGAYQASGAYQLKPEDLNYYSNETINNALVSYYDNKQEQGVYVSDKLQSVDPYSVFLDGPSSFLKIENAQSTQDKTLLMVRDSYGSALAPLLIPYYKTIYLIDLRYTKWEYIEQEIDVPIDDIMLVYGQQSINESNNMK